MRAKNNVLVFVIIVLAVLLTFSAKFASPNRLTGTLHLKGLQGPVTVYRDRYGVPHIQAYQSDADAYFALGYVHAQDRLWQMVFQKHVAQGSLSELFGKATLKQDEYLRTWGFYRAAETAWPSLDPKTQQMIIAYTAGVNAFIKQGNYPLQFSLIHYTPKPWTVIDSIAWQKMLAWDLQSSWEEKIKNYLLLNKYDYFGVNYFRPPYPSDAPTVLSEEDLQQMHLTVQAFAKQKPVKHLLLDLHDLAQQIAFSDNIKQALGFSDAPGKGSNNWVVSGRFTDTGKPLLANDTHLELQSPSIWYLAEMKAPGFHVYGATIPGLPGVIIGHNDHIAWAITNGDPDTQDLYILPKTAKLRVLHEIIHVKGGESINFPVYLSKYGPVISSVDPHAQELHLRLAIKWTGLMPGDTTLEAFGLLSYAKNWNDFVKALRYFVVPTQNFLYADTRGNIGYYYPGKIPIRNGWEGSLPVPPDADHQWMGYIPFKNLPHVYNPKEGYILSANNKAVPDSYPYQLTFRWKTEPYRAERIKQLLLNSGKLSVKKFEAMQLDTKSLCWEDLKPVLMRVEPLDRDSKEAKRLLASWAGDMSQESVAATVFEFWLKQLATLIPKEVQFGSRWLEPLYLKHILLLPTQQKFLNNSLMLAMQDLRKSRGSNESSWQWGKVHHAVFNELGLGEAGSIAWIWRRSIGTPGGYYTVDVGTFDPVTWQQTVGAAYRQIIDLSNLSNSEFMQTLGQSENPMDQHYDDLMPMWVRGSYIQMKDFTDYCQAHTKACLSLLPVSQ